METTYHRYWQCRNPEMRRIREKIANDAPAEEEQRITRDPLEWPDLLRSHGIMVNTPNDEDPCVDIVADTPQQGGNADNGGEKWAWVDDFIESWILSESYTDGACSDQGSKWARAGYGIFYYPKCPRNVSCPLGGMYQ